MPEVYNILLSDILRILTVLVLLSVELLRHTDLIGNTIWRL